MVACQVMVDALGDPRDCPHRDAFPVAGSGTVEVSALVEMVAFSCPPSYQERASSFSLGCRYVSVVDDASVTYSCAFFLHACSVEVCVGWAIAMLLNQTRKLSRCASGHPLCGHWAFPCLPISCLAELRPSCYQSPRVPATCSGASVAQSLCAGPASPLAVMPSDASQAWPCLGTRCRNLTKMMNSNWNGTLQVMQSGASDGEVATLSWQQGCDDEENVCVQGDSVALDYESASLDCGIGVVASVT